MHALFFETSDVPVVRPLHRTSLSDQDGHDEKWLQSLIFDHPEIIPIDVLDPGAGIVVPLCRELAIPKQGGTVFLDLLGVTSQGRLVLVECKLWRNPQARREVIAQILEYAALLRRWTYADLTARLKASFAWTGANPVFERVGREIAGLEEGRFVDAVSRSLAGGDFDLIVAGDGIRSDVQAIASHLNGASGLSARLAFVEFQLWSDSDGRTLVVPAVPLRTEIVQQRVVLGRDDLPMQLEAVPNSEDKADRATETDRSIDQVRNRIFWQSFIDRVRFDHPEQSPPRHGGNNWVRLELPQPASGMTAYRNKDSVGLYITLVGPTGARAFDDFEADLSALEEEVGTALTLTREKEIPFKGIISATRPFANLVPGEVPELRAWLVVTANRLVNTFRPRLAMLERELSPNATL